MRSMRVVLIVLLALPSAVSAQMTRAERARDMVEAMQAIRIGMLSAADRKAGLQAARTVKEKGVDKVDAATIARAWAFCPEYVVRCKQSAGMPIANDRARLHDEYFERFVNNRMYFDLLDEATLDSAIGIVFPQKK